LITTEAPNLTFTGAGGSTTVAQFGYTGTSSSSGMWDTINFGSTAARIYSPAGALLCKSLVLNSSVDFLTNSVGISQHGTGTITSNGCTLYYVSMLYSTCNLTLGDNLNLTLGVSHGYGTFNLNGFNVTTASYSSSSSNARTLNFGTGNITLNSAVAGSTALSVATATGFTWTGTGGFIAAMSTTRTFTFGTTGGSTSNAPNLSLTSGASIPTLTTGSWFNVLDFTGSTGTPPATSLNLNGLVLGGGTYTSLTPTMIGTGTITSNGKTLPSLTINSSGTTTLSGALTTTGATTITAGTLDLAGFTMTTPSVTSASTSARSITGAGTINVSGAWTISNGTNFTGSNYTINMTSASAKTFAGGSGSYGSLVQAGAGILTISGSNALANISATTQPSTITCTAGTTQTLANFTLSGTLGNLVTINSSTAGTQFTLSKTSGTVAPNYLSIKDSNAIGGATWNAYNIAGTNTDAGNNTGWILISATPPVTGQFMAFF
jgi:autotransporter-associated beta strand protein